MEEVQALASRVAIIGTKMLASGTLPVLRNRYGGTYRVRATYTSADQEDDIRALLNRKFGDQILNLRIGYQEANFELPHVTGSLGGIMQKMEGLMESKTKKQVGESAASNAAHKSKRSKKLLLKDYTITEPTMDEVFMNVLGERR